MSIYRSLSHWHFYTLTEKYVGFYNFFRDIVCFRRICKYIWSSKNYITIYRFSITSYHRATFDTFDHGGRKINGVASFSFPFINVLTIRVVDLIFRFQVCRCLFFIDCLNASSYWTRDVMWSKYSTASKTGESIFENLN